MVDILYQKFPNIYIITNYIGETGLELKDPVTVHKKQIRDPTVWCLTMSGQNVQLKTSEFCKLFIDVKNNSPRERGCVHMHSSTYSKLVNN